MIPPRRTTRAVAPQNADSAKVPTVGDRIEILWEGDDVYFRGTLVRAEKNTWFNFLILYDDGEGEVVDLNCEYWRYCGEDIDDLNKSFVPGDITELWPQNSVRPPGDSSLSSTVAESSSGKGLEDVPEPVSPTSICRTGLGRMHIQEPVQMLPIKARLKLESRRNTLLR